MSSLLFFNESGFFFLHLFFGIISVASTVASTHDVCGCYEIVFSSHRQSLGPSTRGGSGSHCGLQSVRIYTVLFINFYMKGIVFFFFMCLSKSKYVILIIPRSCIENKTKINIIISFGEEYATLKSRVLRTLCDATSPEKSLTTQYGGIVAISLFGAKAIDAFLLPVVSEYWQKWDDALATSTDIEQRLELLMCQEAVLVCIAQNKVILWLMPKKYCPRPNHALTMHCFCFVSCESAKYNRTRWAFSCDGSVVWNKCRGFPGKNWKEPLVIDSSPLWEKRLSMPPVWCNLCILVCEGVTVPTKLLCSRRRDV